MSGWPLRGVVCLVLVGWVAAAAAQETRRTIWDGVFSAEQAARGQQQYMKGCAGCHAEDLLGNGNAPALVGQQFLGRFDGSSTDDLLQTIRATMPQEAPNSLALDAYVDIVSFVLKSNGSPAGSVELPADSAKLQQILVTATSR
jgi:mono/diheme cytochrome c family protein